VDKQKIIKIVFIILSIVLFLFLFTSATKKAIGDVSKEANASIQIFASEHAQIIFNKEVFKSYRLCKKRAKKNKNIHNYVEYCEAILNDASIPDDEYLTHISRKFYHYNWLTEKFSIKSGKIVYAMTDKDNYLSSKQCLFMLANRITTSAFTSFMLSVLFYFSLILIQKLSKILFKKTLNKVIAAVGILMFLCWYYAYNFNIDNASGGGMALMSTGVSLTTNIPAILKTIITILSVLIIYKEFKINKYSFWGIGFLIILFVFNPLFPIVQKLMPMGITNIINIICEIFFVVYLIKEYKSFNT